MTTTTVLSEDTATIVRDDVSRFHWGPVLAGAVIATAITFFLIAAGSALGLSLVSAYDATQSGVKTFITLGAIYFISAQAFGFAVGGHVTGRLIGPAMEETEEENFRTDAHGLAVWALGVVFGLTLLAITAGLGLTGATAASKPDATPASYWADRLFRTTTIQQSSLGYRQFAQNDIAPDVLPQETDAAPQPLDMAPTPMSSGVSTLPAMALPPRPVAEIKAEAARLLTAAMAKDGAAGNSDRTALVNLVAENTALSPAAARARVNDVESDMRASAREVAEAARKTATYLAVWTALALLFSAVVCVVATLSARWEDDRDIFGRPRVRTGVL